jgi:hypothetical protein
LKVTDVSGELIASTFSMKQVASRVRLAVYFMVVSCLASLKTIKMETICSPETLADFQHNARRYIQEHRTLFITTAMRTSNPTNSYSTIFEKH